MSLVPGLSFVGPEPTSSSVAAPASEGSGRASLCSTLGEALSRGSPVIGAPASP